MKLAFVRGIVLLFTFVVAFLFTTALMDTLDRYNGYYAQGIKESQEVSE